MKSIHIFSRVGPFYITDLDRPKSIFEADSNLMQQVNDGINADGSNLGHVTAVCLWTDINARYCKLTIICQTFIIVNTCRGKVDGRQIQDYHKMLL